MDAQLFKFPEYLPKKLGRKPIKGKRITLKALLTDSTQLWQSLYDKKGELTFVDIIAVVRRSIWSKRFSKSANHDDLVKIIDQDVELILDQLALAA